MAQLLGKLVFACTAAWAAALAPLPSQARVFADQAPYCAALQGRGCDVALTSLPAEAQAVQAQIRRGGPFRHEKDGVVFGNRERLLPHQRRGYYREYTVDTPGVRNRGAKRIVCGGRAVTAPETCYYSDDHYASFRRIVNE